MTASTKAALQQEIDRLDLRISQLQCTADIAEKQARSVEIQLAQLRSAGLEIRLDLNL